MQIYLGETFNRILYETPLNCGGKLLKIIFWIRRVSNQGPWKNEQKFLVINVSRVRYRFHGYFLRTMRKSLIIDSMEFNYLDCVLVLASSISCIFYGNANDWFIQTTMFPFKMLHLSGHLNFNEHLRWNHVIGLTVSIIGIINEIKDREVSEVEKPLSITILM